MMMRCDGLDARERETEEVRGVGVERCGEGQEREREGSGVGVRLKASSQKE